MASRVMKEETKDFLLAEFELLREMRDRVINRSEERIKFYFSLLSGAGAFLALAPQFFTTGQGFYIIILVVLIALLIFGVLTLDRLISGHVAARIYARGINRVRRYFVDNDKSITKYLILPSTDDIPELGIIGFTEKKGANTGNVSMMIYTNTILIGAICLITFVQLLNVQLIYAIIAIIIFVIISLFVHFRYYARQIRKVQKKISVNFPKETNTAKKR